MSEGRVKGEKRGGRAGRMREGEGDERGGGLLGRSRGRGT